MKKERKRQAAPYTSCQTMYTVSASAPAAASQHSSLLTEIHESSRQPNTTLLVLPLPARRRNKEERMNKYLPTARQIMKSFGKEEERGQEREKISLLIRKTVPL